jgi:hypothetical protein
MKIKILNSCSGLDFSFTKGETIEAPEELAEELVKAGHAEAVEAPKPEKKKK